MDIGDVTTLANPEIVEQIRIMVQGEAKVATKAAPKTSSVLLRNDLGVAELQEAPSTELHHGRIARKPGMATRRQLHSRSTLLSRQISSAESLRLVTKPERRKWSYPSACCQRPPSFRHVFC